MKKYFTFKTIATTVFFSLTFVFVVQYQVDATWQAPTTEAPLSNFSAPLHEGSESQTKTGGLSVGGLTSDQGIFLPTASLLSSLPSTVLLWVGGIARVNDVCLNSNQATCLSSYVSGKKLIISGRGTTVSNDDTLCHPYGGCGPRNPLVPASYIVMPVPFAMTVKNLKVYSKFAVSAGTCSVYVMRFIGSCGNVSHEDAPTCTLSAGNNKCESVTNSIKNVSAGDCLGISFMNSQNGSCPAEVSWTFEGSY